MATGDSGPGSAADDDFFGYYNSENSIHDDYSIIPAHQRVGLASRANLEAFLKESSLDLQLEAPGNHSFQTPTVPQNVKKPRKDATKRGEYVDMMTITQSQKTATYTGRSTDRPRKRKASSKRKSTGKKRRSVEHEEESRSSSRSETSLSEGSVSHGETQEQSENSCRNCHGSQQASFRGDDSEHSSGRSSRKERSPEDSGKFLANKLIEREKKRVLDLIQAQEECFACMWARRDYDKVDDKDVELLENFFYTRYARMNRKAFCAVMEKLYRVNVQEPYAKRGLKLPEWSKEMIEEHILYHDLDPEIVFTEVLHTFFTTFMEIQNSFFVEKKVMVKASDPEEIDPTTGGPLEYEYEITKWIPDTRNIRCGIEVAKALREFFKLSNSEFAPERKRKRAKNLSPSLITAERVRFSAK